MASVRFIAGQPSQASPMPLLFKSILSSPPGQVSSASQTPSLSESSIVPVHSQLLSIISFVVQSFPSLQTVPTVQVAAGLIVNV